MNADTFMENFGHLADAPGGINRLRTLVLELAFDGKLDTGNAPTRRSQWTHSTIGDIASEIIPGFACSKANVDPNGYVHLRTHNVGRDGTLNFDLMIRVLPDKVDARKSAIRAGDLIFNNTNSQELVGKTCLVDKDYDFAFSNHLTVVRFIEDIESSFVVRYFNFLLRTGFFSRICNRWIGQAGINSKAMKALRIDYPAICEQRRIVNQIEKIFVLCDELETRQRKRRTVHVQLNKAALDRLTAAETPAEFKTAWSRVRDNFDSLYSVPETVGELRQAILQLAVQGKLVPQDSEDEPASVLITKIDERANQEMSPGKRRQMELAALSKANALWETPCGWEWVHFGKVTINRDGERIPLSKAVRHNRNGPYDYYGASGVIDHIDGFLFEEPLLLIGEDGANLVTRSKPIAFIAEGQFWVNNHAHVLDSISLDCLRYLEIFINAIDLKPYVTGTAQPKMNQAKMNSILVAFPPENEQKRIVQRVQQLLTICDNLETQLTQQQADADKLTEAMVAAILAGDVLPAASREFACAESAG